MLWPRAGRAVPVANIASYDCCSLDLLGWRADIKANIRREGRERGRELEEIRGADKGIVSVSYPPPPF